MPTVAAAPPESRYRELVKAAKSAGLTTAAAEKYAALGWWGEHYGYRTPPILSGKRSKRRQLAMQRAWDAGDRQGLAVRPASDSSHTRGEGWDLPRGPHLALYGYWAPLLGVRWGGTFRTPDPGHFDLGAD